MRNTTPRESGRPNPGPTSAPPDELPRPLLLPTRDFAEVMEYLGEWEIVGGTRTGRPDGPTTPAIAGRMLGGDEVGPYCMIDLSQLGGPMHRAIAAVPTDASLEALQSRIVTDDDRLHFKVIGHKHSGRVLVVACHGSILGDHWLAYVEADTLPPYPYAQRDERVEETCQALRDNGHTPYLRRLQNGVVEIEPAERATGIKARIDALGAVTRIWGNGHSIVEPPRDSGEARRVAEQLNRSSSHRRTAAAAAAASRAPDQPLEQQALFSDEPQASPEVNGTVPVRRSTVDDTVVEVLARSKVSDDLVVLPDQLERALYEKVNRALTALGGKWNRRRGGHVFLSGQPISDELAAIVDGGVLERMLTGYFPTPRPLAEQLIELGDVRPEHLVLEPSAGRGAIADLLAHIVPADRLYIVEREPTHHQALERAGYRPPQLICADFLTTTALPAPFDRIVMNPPFEQKQDVAHVTHAYELLAPGGRLAAITSAGLAFRTDPVTRALRELIEQSDGASITENPSDTFKASGTSAATVTVTLSKPV